MNASVKFLASLGVSDFFIVESDNSVLNSMIFPLSRIFNLKLDLFRLIFPSEFDDIVICESSSLS